MKRIITIKFNALIIKDFESFIIDNGGEIDKSMNQLFGNIKNKDIWIGFESINLESEFTISFTAYSLPKSKEFLLFLIKKLSQKYSILAETTFVILFPLSSFIEQDYRFLNDIYENFDFRILTNRILANELLVNIISKYAKDYKLNNIDESISIADNCLLLTNERHFKRQIEISIAYISKKELLKLFLEFNVVAEQACILSLNYYGLSNDDFLKLNQSKFEYW